MNELIDHVATETSQKLRFVLTPFKQRDEVWNWACNNKITIEYQGNLGGQDCWYIENDQSRAWFMLRWA